MRPLAEDIKPSLSPHGAAPQRGMPPADLLSPAARSSLDGGPAAGHARLSPASVAGGPGALLKEEPPSTPHGAAFGAALAADGASPVAGVQANGDAWPWAPGTVLNIDQEKWKALLAEPAPPVPPD